MAAASAVDLEARAAAAIPSLMVQLWGVALMLARLDAMAAVIQG